MLLPDIIAKTSNAAEFMQNRTRLCIMITYTNKSCVRAHGCVPVQPAALLCFRTAQTDIALCSSSSLLHEFAARCTNVQILELRDNRRSGIIMSILCAYRIWWQTFSPIIAWHLRQFVLSYRIRHVITWQFCFVVLVPPGRHGPRSLRSNPKWSHHTSAHCALMLFWVTNWRSTVAVEFHHGPSRLCWYRVQQIGNILGKKTHRLHPS